MRKGHQKKGSEFYHEIYSFRKHKYWWAILLVLIGLSGVFIPIVPGFLLFLLALALIRPGMMAKIRRYLKK
jgi:uncharacterized membrane protein